MGMKTLFISVKKLLTVIVMPRARTYCVAMVLKLGQNKYNKVLSKLTLSQCFTYAVIDLVVKSPFQFIANCTLKL